MATKALGLTKGDKISYTQYFTVQSSMNKNEELSVLDDGGQSITIKGTSLIEQMNSSSTFSQIQKVSRTELAEIFKNHPRVVMSVNYNLKIDEKDVIAALIATYPNKGGMTSLKTFEKTVKDTVKQALEGKERTMVGRHYGSFDDFGRASFIDMEIEKDNTKSYDTRTRQVDPRTINWIIVNDVKYIKK